MVSFRTDDVSKPGVSIKDAKKAAENLHSMSEMGTQTKLFIERDEDRALRVVDNLKPVENNKM